MILFLITILGVSLAGSLHCAGMCGAFVVMATGGQSWRERAVHQVAYHGGRLLTYSALGMIAGSLGSLVNLAGKQAQLAHLAAYLAGAVMILGGLAALLRSWGIRLPRRSSQGRINQAVQKIFRRAMATPPFARALAIGLCTTLLPCGWLYLFAIMAASTGSWLGGGAVMAAFWLGTVPILAFLGLGTQTLLAPVARKVPWLMPVILMGFGVWMVVQRDKLNLNDLMQTAQQQVEDADGDPTRLNEEVPPCCRGKTDPQPQPTHE